TIFKAILGGVVFLAVGVGLSFILRKALGKSTSGDWQDDAYLFGASTVFLLAAVLVAGLLVVINSETFFRSLAHVAVVSGVFLTALSYCSGLVRVGRAGPGRAVWVAVIVLAGAALAGSLLNFGLSVGPELIAGDVSSRLRESMPGQEDFMKDWQKAMRE